MMPLTFTRGARFACAFSLLIAIALCCSSPALAASGGANSFEKKSLHLTSGTPAHTSSGSFGGTIARTIVGLLIVIAVIYGLTWVLKQARNSRNPSLGEGLVQIAQLPLGPSRSVALVRVGAELHMLGVAEHGVTGIRVFSEEEAYELGIPFEPEAHGGASQGGGTSVRRMVDSLRRFTVR